MLKLGMKKVLTVLLAALFVVSFTAIAASADMGREHHHRGGYGGGFGDGFGFGGNGRWSCAMRSGVGGLNLRYFN